MGDIKTVDDLEVYQRSYRLALEIYHETLKFPEFERYELGAQMRRCSKSIPTNIAEGFSSRSSSKQYMRYLNIARESCDEMFVHLRFSRDLQYISKDKIKYFMDEYTIVAKQLTNLIKAWSKF